MRDIYCHYCGQLVMRVENGSKIKAGTVCICADCNDPKPSSNNTSNQDDMLDSIRALFGMKI